MTGGVSFSLTPEAGPSTPPDARPRTLVHPLALGVERRREIVVDPDAEGLEAARALVASVATELAFDEDAIWAMNVAVTEALTNAIDHGEPTDGGVHLSLLVEHDQIVLEVWGGPSAPSELQQTEPDPRNRGRGIVMMTALMDAVELRQHDRGTRTRLEKRRRPHEGPPLRL